MDKIILAIDLGGTKISAAIVDGSQLSKVITMPINGALAAGEVLEQVFSITDSLVNSNVQSIGIGVPGLVDGHGVVSDVVNIPSWTEIPLQKILEQRYGIPAVVNNDANCFALGEYHFGKGKGTTSMIGLTIGTGLGSGIIINQKLYSGSNCGAGEFGMVEYLDKYFEYYASGQFFKNVHHIDGEKVFESAKAGQAEAMQMYKEMGFHLGNAIKMIMYTMDVELIVIGGSVRHAWQYFSESMWQQFRTFAFPRSLNRLRIEVSELENSALLGASVLCRK
ncbi:MAG: ROK family protein [Ginsengibacter sp.]